MSELLEHILNGDYVSANELFEERMVNLQEKKLYEAKRIVAAELNEVHGGKLPSEVRAAPGYRGRASDILGDPTAGKRKRPPTSKKSPKKPEEEPKPSSSMGLKTAIKKGIRRTSTRLAVGTGQVLGKGLGAAARGIETAKSAPGKFKQGVEKFVSDPLSPSEKKKETVKVKRKAVPGTETDTKKQTKTMSSKVLRGTGKALGFAGRVVGSMLAYAEE